MPNKFERLLAHLIVAGDRPIPNSEDSSDHRGPGVIPAVKLWADRVLSETEQSGYPNFLITHQPSPKLIGLNTALLTVLIAGSFFKACDSPSNGAPPPEPADPAMGETIPEITLTTEAPGSPRLKDWNVYQDTTTDFKIYTPDDNTQVLALFNSTNTDTFTRLTFSSSDVDFSLGILAAVLVANDATGIGVADDALLAGIAAIYVGEESVSFLIDQGLLSPEQIATLAGIAEMHRNSIDFQLAMTTHAAITYAIQNFLVSRKTTGYLESYDIPDDIRYVEYIPNTPPPGITIESIGSDGVTPFKERYTISPNDGNRLFIDPGVSLTDPSPAITVITMNENGQAISKEPPAELASALEELHKRTTNPQYVMQHIRGGIEITKEIADTIALVDSLKYHEGTDKLSAQIFGDDMDDGDLTRLQLRMSLEKGIINRLAPLLIQQIDPDLSMNDAKMQAAKILIDYQEQRRQADTLLQVVLLSNMTVDFKKWPRFLEIVNEITDDMNMEDPQFNSKLAELFRLSK